MRKPYKKHFVILKNQTMKVKDWMRQNPSYFKNIKGVPTSKQIGKVLFDLKYNVLEDCSIVIYKKRSPLLRTSFLNDVF